MSGDVDLDKIETMKKMIPVGKCLDVDIKVDGENMGMLVCRRTKEEITMESKDGSMTGSLKIVDAKKKKM